MSAFLSRSDVALAFRLMRKQPVLALTAILSLAAGIAMATTGFTMLEAVAYARLPFRGGDRFVLVDVYEDPQARRASVETERLLALREGSSALRYLGALDDGAANLSLPSGEVALITATFITPDAFTVLPYTPLIGRTLTSDDGRAGAPAVALLRESVWRKHFSADPRVIGTAALFSGVQRTIVGVMPDTLLFPTSADIWLPLADTKDARVFGVLQELGTERLASEQLMAVSRRYEAERGDAPTLRLIAFPFTDVLSRGLDILTTVLLTALILVLLVISANVANLVLARSLARSTELAVRTALGATRSRLIGQIFVEVLLLGTVAAILGLAGSRAAFWWIERTVTDMPFWVSFAASPRTIVFVVIVTLIAAGVAGIIPALRVTRQRPARAMAGSRSASRGFGRIGSLMVAVQITLSIALLNAALVMARGVAGYMEGGPELPARQLLTARVTVEEAPTGETITAIRDALEDLPGVQVAGLASSLPRLSPPVMMTTVRSGLSDSTAEPQAAPVVAASQGFLESLGARPSAGRLFESGDFLALAHPVAIVNEPFVRKFFGGTNPVGHQLRLVEPDSAGSSQPWREIIGVVPDLGLSAGDERLAAGYYVPLREDVSFFVALRVPAGTQLSDTVLRASLARVDPGMQVRDVMPLEAVGAEDRAVFAGLGAAFTALGGIALLLAVIGVYAMLSFTVTQRTREIAIRSALGASRASIMRSVAARTCVPLAIGAVAGPALATLFVSARGIFAFRLPDSSGVWGLPAVCVVMIAAGLVATWIPTRRALRISTADALRADCL